MKPDDLHELLRNADAEAGSPPPLPVDLPQRVRRLAHRRFRQRIVLSAAAASLLVAVGATVFMRGPGAHPGPGKPETGGNGGPGANAAQAPRYAVHPDREADVRRAIAHRLAESQARQTRLAALQVEANRPDPVWQARGEVDQAAFVLVHQADRLQQELHLTSSATELYRQTIRLFPDTPSAGLARQRLAEIEQNKGGTL